MCSCLERKERYEKGYLVQLEMKASYSFDGVVGSKRFKGTDNNFCRVYCYEMTKRPVKHYAVIPAYDTEVKGARRLSDGCL